jgi:hypothetical protein
VKTILALAAVLLFSSSSNALGPQPTPDRGSIYGLVTDARNGEAIASVQVSIADAKIGALTTLEGKFLLMNIPLGEATVRFEYLCSHPVTISVRLTPEMSQRRIDLGMPHNNEERCDWGIF